MTNTAVQPAHHLPWDLARAGLPGRTGPDSGGARPELAIAAAVAASALAIVACRSGNPNAKSASNSSTQLLKFAKCMRSHGVASWPDPSGGGFHIPGSEIDQSSPAFKAARSACSKLLSGGGRGTRRPTAQQIEMTRRISQCMRQHGVASFPDPILTPPSSPTGYSMIVDLGGLVLALPSTINPSSTGLVQAANACHLNWPGA